MTEVEPKSEYSAKGDGSDVPSRPPSGREHIARFRLRVVPILITLSTVALSALLGRAMWEAYMAAPWTRDGRVRAEIVDIAPEVSNTVVAVNVQDNQFVRKGDLLFEIDPARFELAVKQAEATAESRRQDMILRQSDARRRRNLEGAVSAEERERFGISAGIAAAAYNEALAALDLAKLNLNRTKVYSTANGYATNVRLRVGAYATAGQRAMSIIDSESFWIYAYFEETQLARIRVGDTVRIALMGFNQPVSGHVASFSRGITDRNGQLGNQGLQDVDPIFTWVRLAQRIPIRIHIDAVPLGVELVAGMTCTVLVEPKSEGVGIIDRVFGWLTAAF
jgi:multidrug resistance efflux pump